jgi:hypothetical protein
MTEVMYPRPCPSILSAAANRIEPLRRGLSLQPAHRFAVERKAHLAGAIDAASERQPEWSADHLATASPTVIASAARAASLAAQEGPT